MNAGKILKRSGLRILSIVLFFVTRSRVLADLAWDPPAGPDSADNTLRYLFWIILICIVGSVWLFAKARMLKSYNKYESGWSVIIPFYGRYLEYKNYWDFIYYWINFGILLLGFVLTIATWHVMYVPLLAWIVITVLMRMKTMEAFGQNKFLGLLELLGLGFVLDCLCAYMCRRNKIKRDQKGELEPLIKLPELKIPSWIWIVLVLLLCIFEIFLDKNNQKNERLHMTQTVQAITEQVQTAIIATQTNAAETTKTPNPYGHYVGDIITFGTYEQDEWNGADAIEWQVLAIENGQALLLSRYGLEVKTFHNTQTDVTWENSDLRTWLNGNFYNNSFTPSEKASIQQVWNSNPDNKGHGIEGENVTQDNIFLLSINEAKKYLLIDSSRQCEATYHAQQNGASVNSDGYSSWWLRSTAGRINRIAYVHADGSVVSGGFYFDNDTFVVRPALWLNL